MSAMGQQITNLASNTQENFKQGFSQFSNNRYVSGSRDFLNSNSLVAKFAFLILVLIVFILSLRLSFQFINWIFSPSQNPRLVKGMLNGLHDGPLTFSSNPNISGAIPILRSNNESHGVEFTWSVWINIYTITPDGKGKKKHIFHKGSPTPTSGGEPLTQAPGLWIAENTNTLVVRVDTYSSDEDATNGTSTTAETPYELISIPYVPLNKWINVMIRVQGKIVDVFINGAISRRHRLQQVVRQNYGHTHVLDLGGYDGELSNLTYYSHALNVSEILDIVNNGPDLTRIGDSGPGSFPPYFALRWYFTSPQKN